MIATETRGRSASVPLLVAGLACAGLALLLESHLKLPLRMPGHRALPGAFALLLIAEATPATILVGFAALVGAAVGLTTGNPWLAAVWMAPALGLAFVRPARAWTRIAVAIAAGLLFGLLRYLALPDGAHHTPEIARLGGHLAFGGLGAFAVVFDPRRRRSASSGEAVRANGERSEAER